MKERHIILRNNMASVTRGPFAAGRTAPFGLESVVTPINLEVEIEEMERSRVAAVNRNAEVVAVAPVMPMKLIEPTEIKDTPLPTGNEIAWGIKAVGADTSPYTGDGVTVSVLDTGIDANHPAFKGVQIVEKDFTQEGNGDQHGHGTHCAGTIFGRDVGGMRIGVARGLKKAVIGKVLGTQGGSTEQIFKAVLWALDQGANVISMSLGIDFPGYVKRMIEQGVPTEPATSRALEAYRANVLLFDRLSTVIKTHSGILQGSVIVAAAGNESNRPEWEIAVSPPAVADGVVSVADGVVSVAAAGEGSSGLEVAYFSNTGADISGPGVKIISAKPGSGLQSMSGTSMATPHVAGVAVLWAEKLKKMGNLNTDFLIARVVGTATSDKLKQGFDPFDVGAGLARAPQQ